MGRIKLTLNDWYGFKLLFPLTAVLVFIIVSLRCLWIPITQDEADTYFFYIQSGEFIPFKAHPDANNHVLNSFLCWISYKLFGSSLLSLRLPNILGLLALIFGIGRISRHMERGSSKLILLAGFLLSFNWLDFFGVCRGYGLSMGLLLLALSYILSYLSVSDKKYLHLLYGYVLLQLSVSANLVLIVPVITITSIISLKQLYCKKFFNWKNLLLLIIQLLLSIFWLSFSFFLKDKGALYLGAGNSYWNVTFSTLIKVLIGQENLIIDFLIVLSFLLVTVYALYLLIFRIKKGALIYAQTGLFFSVIVLGLLIIGFYLMKSLLHINFPENRSGLFFYVFFMLSIVFVLELINAKVSSYLSVTFFVMFLGHFLYNINFNKHILNSYFFYPARFYEKIQEDQKHSDKILTIGGQQGKEVIWAYFNIVHGGALNSMAFNNTMTLNTDYCIAHISQRIFYEPYYKIVDYDSTSQFTLIKREKPLTKRLIKNAPDMNVEIKPDNEFTGYLSIIDSVFTNTDPIEISFDLRFIETPSPLYAWMVLQIDGTESLLCQYKYVPLNWIRTNWAESPAKTYHLAITTDKLPAKIHRITFHTWNRRNQGFKFNISNIKLFQLEGDGLGGSIPRM